MSNKTVQFKAVIYKCIYNSEDFKTYAAIVDAEKYPFVHLNKYDNVSIIGNLPELTLEIEYDITAIEKESKYGVSYQVVNIRRDIPSTTEDVYNFLKEILTENQASVLVQTYPDIIDRVKENRLDDIDLNQLKGIKEKTFKKIKDKIISNFHLMDLVSEFKNVLSLNMIKKIYDKYSSIEIIKQKLKTEPYTTLTKISGIGFKTADSIIAELQKENIIDFGCDIKTSPDRCYACILYLLNENENEGNTKMNLADLRSACMKLVPACSHHFATVIKSYDIYYDKNTMDSALRKTYDIERYIASNMLKRIDNKADIWEYDIEKYRSVNNAELSDEQIGLLNSVCNNNITILTAPAGSGKSFSTKALINMLKDNKKSFILASPTGKAAKKLSEYTEERANTIHRTLGYNGSGFVYDEFSPLITDVIILDEVGMVDIKLFYYLLKALSMSTKIVLIGDIYQLNSVGCGALLRDLVSFENIPKVTFSKIFRMGKGGVLTACTYVRQNKKFIYNNSFTQIGEDKSYSFVPVSKDNINDTLIALYSKLLTRYSANDITVISSYNVGENGCGKLNKLLQPIANPHVKDNKYISIGKDDNQIRYYIGDVVIQCCNNYNALCDDDETCFVANGEQGHIVDINENYITIRFDDLNVIYHKSELSANIKHAFALSCHKMQGSQNKVIIFCCPSSHMFMLSNNIVYTAISRAEKIVYHLTDLKTLNVTMNKLESEKRNTMLGDLLNGKVEIKENDLPWHTNDSEINKKVNNLFNQVT